MQKFSFYFFLIGFSFFSNSLIITNLNAQCTVNMIDGGTSEIITGISQAANLGQSFTACSDGVITSLMINVGRTNTIPNINELGINIGVFQGGSNGLPFNIIETLQYDGVSSIITFNLSTPFPVQDDGTVYAFEIFATDCVPFCPLFLVNISDPSDYPDGRVLGAGGASDIDLDFKIEITPNSSIPTMSQWGLIIFGLLTMNLGLVFLRRKEEVLA